MFHKIKTIVMMVFIVPLFVLLAVPQKDFVDELLGDEK